MHTLKNKTPDWPVDMDLIMREIRMCRRGDGDLVMAMAGALQDAGYQANTVYRSTSTMSLVVESDGSVRTGYIMEQQHYAIRLGSLLLTPSLDTDWAGVLRTAHKNLDLGVHKERRWMTRFVNEETLATSQQILEHTRGDESWSTARRRAGIMVCDFLQGHPRPAFPIDRPEESDSSFEAAARCILQEIRYSDQMKMKSSEHTLMGILAVHLAGKLAGHGLEVEAFECREYTEEGLHTMERTHVFLQQSGQEPFLCNKPGDEELLFITEATTGPRAALQPGNCSVLRKLPAWTSTDKPEGRIEEGLNKACAALIQARLHRGVSPVDVATPTPRPRM